MRQSEPETPPIEELLATIRGARFADGVRCPRCGFSRLQRWGSFSGRQRHRCVGCRRTFSDLTGTPAAYIKKLRLWGLYAERLAASTTVRKSASSLAINATTSFRWRHRLLGPLRAQDTETLSGWIELDSTRFPYSEKGRRAGRPPGERVSGTGGGDTPAEKKRRVTVLVACDRKARVVTSICRGRRPSALELDETLGKRISGRPVLSAAHGQYGPGNGFARRKGCVFHDARPGAALDPKVRPRVNLHTVLAYVRRLHEWIFRFHGVATKYLVNYLIWHRHVDRTWGPGLAIEVLRWPLPVTFE